MEKENRQFKMISLFDGSGSFPLAASLCGIEPVAASEVEPFPIKVTRARFPNMKHYGDIGKINGAELEPVDLVTGGSPCQSLSVAGKRDGMSKKCLSCGHKVLATEESDICPECGGVMEYTRSGLFMEQIRVIKEMREADERRRTDSGTDEHIRPRFMLWENVTGAFTSNKGEDFRAVLEETARVKDKTVTIPRPDGGKWNGAGCIMGNGWSIAWRTLDAQYWGVPQRRRRIALVADFGGQCAGEILFKREGLSSNFTESRHSWQSLTGCFAESVGETGECFAVENHPNDSRVNIDDNGICQALTSRMGTGGGNVPLVMNERQYACTISKDVANTLTGTDYKGVQCLFEPITMQVRCGKEGGGKGALLQKDLSATLDTKNMQTLFQPIHCVENSTGRNTLFMTKDVSPTLVADSHNHAICHPKKAYGICSYASNSMKSDNPNSGIYEADTARTLDVSGGNPACNQGGIAICEPVKTYDVRITSDGTKNARCHCYEADTSRTVDRNGNNPDSNHGGVAICEPVYSFEPGIAKREGSDNRFSEDCTPTLRANMGDNQVSVAYSTVAIEGNGSRPSHKGDEYKESNIMYTLNATEQHAVAYDCRNMVPNNEVSGTLQAKSNGGQSLNYINPVFVENKKGFRMEAFGQYSESDTASAMKARDYKDATDLIVTEYIVRRLTPLECSRLQGLPDWWCDGIEVPEPTEEDLEFWREVFETHREIVTHAKKPKTDKQIIKWMKEPDTDGAKYKMYGNGIALPCFLYVMEGIKEVLEREETSTDNHEVTSN